MTTSRPSSTTSSPDGARRRGLLDGAAVTVRIAGLSLLRGRRGVGLVLLCAAPLAWPAMELFEPGAGAKGGVGFVEILTGTYFPVINLIVALFVGCGAIGEEVDGKTLPYLLTRPVPRSALLIGRWLSSLVAAGALLASAYVALYFATVAPMGAEALWIDLPILGWALVAMALSLVAYCALFLLLSVVVKWPLLVGLALVFVWEHFAVDLPGTVPRWSLLHHVYTLLARFSGDDGYVAIARPYGLELLPATDSLQVLAWTTLIALGLALRRFSRKSFLV